MQEAKHSIYRDCLGFKDFKLKEAIDVDLNLVFQQQKKDQKLFILVIACANHCLMKNIMNQQTFLTMGLIQLAIYFTDNSCFYS